MFKVISNEEIAPALHRMVVEAPRVAGPASPGSSSSSVWKTGAERIPLTIADADPRSRHDHADHPGRRPQHQADRGHARPAAASRRGRARWAGPPRSKSWGKVVCVGGGVGTAVLFPLAKALAEAGNEVVTIIGGRSAALRHPAGRAGRVLQGGAGHHRGRLAGRQGLRDGCAGRDPGRRRAPPGRRVRRGPGADDGGRGQPDPAVRGQDHRRL